MDSLFDEFLRGFDKQETNENERLARELMKISIKAKDISKRFDKLLEDKRG